MCNKLNRVPKKCLHFYSLWRLKGFFKQFLLTSSQLIKNNLKFKLLQNLCQKSMRKIVVGGGRRQSLHLFNSLKISPRCQKNYETYSSSRRREAKPEVIQQSEDVTSVLKKYEKYYSSRRREEGKPEVIQQSKEHTSV